MVWKISSSDKKHVKHFLKSQLDNPSVQRRIQQNITRTKVDISKKNVWKVLVGCLLTTQQRSGPESWVAKFIETKPFPLDYNTCLSKRDVEKFSFQTLSNSNGIRRTNRIASEIATNLTRLEEGLWIETLKNLRRLRKDAKQEVEREVADYIDANFAGFGPKQSRNLLQWLGLTRYEIPIDSRITKWLNNNFKLALNANTLQDRNYYHFVSDGIQHLSKACDVYPCVLDAAIFSSYDGDTRTKK